MIRKYNLKYSFAFFFFDTFLLFFQSGLQLKDFYFNDWPEMKKSFAQKLTDESSINPAITDAGEFSLKSAINIHTIKLFVFH